MMIGGDTMCRLKNYFLPSGCNAPAILLMACLLPGTSSSVWAGTRSTTYEYDSVGRMKRVTIERNGKKTVHRPGSDIIQRDSGRIVRRGGTQPKEDAASIAPKTLRTGPYEIKEELLGEYPSKVSVMAVSQDGRHVAYAMCPPGKMLMEQLMIDGKIVKDFNTDVDEVRFSSDGSIMTAIGRGERSRYMILNRKEYPTMSTSIGETTFTPDGQHVAFPAFMPDGNWIVVDSKPTVAVKPEGRPSDVSISSDGKKVAYKWERKGDSKKIMIVGDTDLMKLGRPGHDSFTFSPDGNHYAYPAKTTSRHYRMVLDGKHVSAEYNSMGRPVFSPNGNRLAFEVGLPDNKQCMVVDGKPGPAYLDVGKPVFSRNSAHFAYVGKLQKGQVVVLDGKTSVVYRHVADDLTFVGHSQVPAYRSTVNNKQYLVVGGRENGTYLEYKDLTTSKNGLHLAYSARTSDGWHTVLNNKRGAVVPKPIPGTLTISPDGQHVAALVSMAHLNVAVVVNGHAGPSYMKIFSSQPHLEKNGTAEYLAVRNRRLYRVTHRLVDKNGFR